MKTSETITEISSALSKAWSAMENPKHNQEVKVKTKKGYTYTFEYTDLGGIIDSIKPHLKNNDLSFLQNTYTEVTERGTFISVITRFVHSSGEWIESSPLRFPTSNNIQDMGGQITYMKRYSLSAMLGISTEKDDDANASMGNQTEFQNKQQSAGDTTREQLLIKSKAGGGTEQQFNEWYAKQAAQGITNEQMNTSLSNELRKRNEKGKK